MKTTRANSQSFRLHHIGRASSTRKTSQSFYQADDTFKLAALNSVTRGIKHGDLSFMTGTNLNKLRVEPIQSNEGLYTSAHNNLTEVRVRYDEMKKQRVFLQRKIGSLKEQIGKYNIFKHDYQEKIAEGNGKVEQLKTKLGEKKQKVEETVIQKKILLHMQWRHKSDKVVYDQRRFDLEKELEYQKKQMAIFNRQGKQNLQSQDRTIRIYQKLAVELQRERLEREQHIRNLEAMIQERLQLQNINSGREAELIEIAQRAIQDKDHSEKQWRKIFLTHIFVNKMLRDKIEKEMEKFKTVEFAFKQIKTATGVNDAKSLVHKYLNKQAVYGELLSKIADNEKVIESLKNETEQLNQESKQLEMEKEVLESVKVKSQDLHDEVRQLQFIEEKALTSDKLHNKMVSWTNRQLKKLSSEKSTEESLAQRVTHYLATLSSELQTADIPEQSLKSQAETLTVRETERVTRVIPKRSRKNSAGEEIFDVDEEETPVTTNQEELQLLNNQHEVIHRENERFMRELRRRKEEERKLLIDKKREVKKEVKAPEIKKQED